MKLRTAPATFLHAQQHISTKPASGYSAATTVSILGLLSQHFISSFWGKAVPWSPASFQSLTLTETEKDCRLRWSSLTKPSLKTSTKRDKAFGQGGGKRREAEFMKISTKGVPPPNAYSKKLPSKRFCSFTKNFTIRDSI